MFSNERFIRFISGLALVLFIVVAVLSIIAIVIGFGVADGLFSGVRDFIVSIEPDDPGGGWLVIGSLFGSMAGGFVGIILAVFGVCCMVANGIAYLPALIGRLVWKKTKNVVVYWICMTMWFVLAMICTYVLIG